MSDTDPDALVSDRDAMVWEALGGERDELLSNGTGDTVEVPQELLDRVLDRLDHLERRVEELEGRGVGDGPEADAPPIVHYANIPEDERGDLLSTSEEIAVTLHVNWDDVAWPLGGGGSAATASVTSDGQFEAETSRSTRRVGVDTKTKAAAKYNPSKLRHELKLLLDRDFQATELYRGLKRLAKLSGGKEHVNEGDGRVHITGGLYEYREQSTADKQDVRRVLWRADDD